MWDGDAVDGYRMTESRGQLQRQAALLRRLADLAAVGEAGLTLRRIEFDERVAHGPAEDLSWEQNEERKLAEKREILALLENDVDQLIPAWVARLVEQIREGHAERQRISAAIKAEQDLPEINWGSIHAVHHLQTTLQAVGDRLDPHLRPLVEAMGSMDRDADEHLAEAVKRAGPSISLAVPALLDMLRRWGIWRMRSQLAEALANASRFDERVLPGLREMLSSEDQDQRRSAIRVLEVLGPGAAELTPQLLRFRTGTEQDRCGMIHALASQRALTPELLDVLEEAMRDENGYVRRSATWALGELTPDPARFVPLLIEACDWKLPLHDTSLPEAAVEALGKYGTKASGALPRLAQFVEGPMKERTVRSDRVRKAVELISGGAGASLPTAPAVRHGTVAEDEPLFPVQYQGRQCYIDRDGKLVIQTRFTSGEAFSEGRAIGRGERRRMFVIDRQGREVFESKWDDIRPYCEALAPIKRAGKWGFIDLEGRVVVEPQYDSVTSFSEGLAGIEIGRAEEKFGKSLSHTRRGKCGFIDRSGAVVIPADWYSAGRFRDGRALVTVGGTMQPNPVLDGMETLHDAKFGFIDRTGRIVIEGGYDLARAFSEGLASVERGNGCARGRCGYIDTRGAEVIPLSWTHATSFSGGVALVRRRGRPFRGMQYVIDRTGAVIGELRHSIIMGFAEGLAAAWSGQAYGFVNIRGDWVIEPQFDQCGSFHNGLAEVQREDWYGLIDRTGRFVWGPTTEDGIRREFESDWAE